MNAKKILTWVFFFLVFLLILQFVGPKKPKAPAGGSGILILAPAKTEYSSGQEVIFTLQNTGSAPIELPSNCPANPLAVKKLDGAEFIEKTAQTSAPCGPTTISIPANGETKVSFKFWNYALFGEPGRYQITASAPAVGTSTPSIATAEITIEEPGVLRKFFRTVFYNPLYNFLILLISAAPMRDLGFAIIVLTLIIRLILLVPSQKAIVSQRRLQELQPQLERVKKEFAGNQERIAQETMKLWKHHKVNPFGSCLPLIIQFPILIALFYVIQNGLNPDNAHLLYGGLKDFDFTNIHTQFLGILDLTKVDKFVLPLLVGLLQFGQLKLAMVKKKGAEVAARQPGDEMQMANKTMTYVMPVMIALFTASVPAGVGLYWGVSTIFALGQQTVANRKKS